MGTDQTSRRRRTRARRIIWDAVSYTLARNIREARRRAGMTQADLSEALGLPRTSTYIRQVESACKVVSLPRLIEIADALGVEPTELLEGIK